MASDEIVLKMCKICGRTFNPVSLEKHERICETSQKCTKRTVFKSFLQRSKEVDLMPIQKKEERRKCSAKKESKPSGPLNNGQSPVNSIPYGYQSCPFCGRHFNQKAADRHISWCQEQKNRLPKTPQNSVALERLQARVKYQAPRPRSKSTNDITRLVKSAESIRESSHVQTHSISAHHQHHPFEENSLKRNSCKNQENTVQKNLEMLKTLRLHLSQLSTSEEHFSHYISKSNVFQKETSEPVVKGKSCYNKSSDQPRFCYNCGTKYPIVNAKFCCECGTERLFFKVCNQTNCEC